MKTTIENEWREMRREAGAPAVPRLDTASIMAAVRAEAAENPVRRLEYVPMAVPNWLGTLAASVAFLVAVGMLARSAGQADQEIGLAWSRSVQPAEFVQCVMPPLAGHAEVVP